MINEARDCSTADLYILSKLYDTVLTGPLDRSALYGVLAEVEALGLDLVEVRQLSPPRKSPESGDSRSP